MQNFCIVGYHVVLTSGGGKQWIKDEVSKQFHDKTTYDTLKKNDWVRILRHKLEEGAKNTILEKKFAQGWSKGLYQIVSVSRASANVRRVYQVRAENSEEPLATHFFRSDLQRVDKDNIIPNRKKTQETLQVNAATGELRPVSIASFTWSDSMNSGGARGMERVKPNPAESIAATREKRNVRTPRRMDL